MVTQMKIKNRDSRIDILKGIGITLMVCGHCGAPFRSFIYLFHMAIFFIASGYCFKRHNSENGKNVLNFIFRKIRGLWLPYVISMSIYSLLHNIFISLNIYTNNTGIFHYLTAGEATMMEVWTPVQIAGNIFKGLLLHGHTQMGSALWFVATLLEISVLYCIVDFAIRKCCGESRIEVCQLLVSFFFLAFGYFMALQKIELGGLNRVLSYYILFYLGVEIRRYNEKFLSMIRKYDRWIALCSFVILLLLQNNEVALDQNQYVNPFFLIFVSLLGWLLLFSIADLLSELCIIKKALVCLGQNTLYVVIGHFLCFKLVNFVGVLMKGWPYYCVAAFPVLFSEGVTWIVYALVGTVIPVLCQLASIKIINCIKKFLLRGLSNG